MCHVSAVSQDDPHRLTVAGYLYPECARVWPERAAAEFAKQVALERGLTCGEGIVSLKAHDASAQVPFVVTLQVADELPVMVDAPITYDVASDPAFAYDVPAITYRDAVGTLRLKGAPRSDS